MSEHVIHSGRHDRARAIRSQNAGAEMSVSATVTHDTWMRFDALARSQKTTKSALLRQLIEKRVSGG